MSERTETTVAGGSVRDTIESIVFAFVLAFTFRAFIVEAFVIPTGSMAPTLLGEHVPLRCQQCGYRYNTDRRWSSRADCPMCDFPIDRAWPVNSENEVQTPPLAAGDRILVLKYAYLLREPKRWDVVVFKNPQPSPSDQGGGLQNYIKRLVGLPGEQLRLIGGNVYTRPLEAEDRPPAPDVPWMIQRKPDHVQHTVWQPIYHNQYAPLDGGDPSRSQRRSRWHQPWRTVEPEDAAPSGWTQPRPDLWHHDGHSKFAALRFNFDRRTGRQFYAYNMLGGGSNGEGDEPVTEMRLAISCTFEAEGALRLTCGPSSHPFRAEIRTDGTAQLFLGDQPIEGQTRKIPNGWLPNQRSEIELWHVDQSVALWVDGQKMLYWEYHPADLGLPLEALASNRLDAPPIAEIAVDGPATLSHIELDRDLFYTQSRHFNYRPDEEPIGVDPLGTLHRPVTIGHDRFYCLGDNSPQSQDSRLWEHIDPWVKAMTADRYHRWVEKEGRWELKPGLEVGLVPRELMIGKAFFVYWPAAHRFIPWMPQRLRAIPNFGQMRFIR